MNSKVLEEIRARLLDWDAEADAKVSAAKAPDYRDSTPGSIWQSNDTVVAEEDDYENVAQKRNLPIETRMLNLENKFDNKCLGYVEVMGEALREMQTEVDIMKSRVAQLMKATGIRDTGM